MEEVGVNIHRQVGTVADPHAVRSESSSQVPSLQLVSLPARRGQRHLSHTAVPGAVGRFHKTLCGMEELRQQVPPSPALLGRFLWLPFQ